MDLASSADIFRGADPAGSKMGGGVEGVADDPVELLTQPAVRRRVTSESPPPLSIICFPSFCLRCVDCRGSLLLLGGGAGWHWEFLQAGPNVDVRL